MPKPYSIDLRKKVLQTIKKMGSITEASKLFDIDRRTIHRWIVRDKVGKLEPFKGNVKKPKKLNPIIIEKYITKHPEETIQQIAKHFNVWYQAIYYHIKKLNFTYKKKNSSTQKEMKKEEKNISEKS